MKRKFGGLESTIAEILQKMGYTTQINTGEESTERLAILPAALIRPITVESIEGKGQCRASVISEVEIVEKCIGMESKELFEISAKSRSRLLKLISTLRRCDEVVDITGCETEIGESEKAIPEEFRLKCKITIVASYSESKSELH